MNQNKFKDTFRLEAEDLLAKIEETTLNLEKNSADLEGVNSLFRYFHTIKGSGSMFGFEQIAKFCHHIEAVLEHVREGRIPVGKMLIDLILKSRDEISFMLESFNGTPSYGNESADIIIAGLNRLYTSEDNPVPEQSPLNNPIVSDIIADNNIEEELKSFCIEFEPGREILTTGIDPAILLAQLTELGPCQITLNTRNVPDLHEFDPHQLYLAWHIVLQTRHHLNDIQDIFVFVEDSSRLVITENQALTNSADQLQHQTGGLDNVDQLQHQTGRLDNVDQLQQQTGRLETLEHLQQPSQSSSDNIRISADKLDQLVNLVGELVIAQARLGQVASRISFNELDHPVEMIERLTADLRDCALNMRMLPIGTIFGKFRRLVRDLAAELNREISLITKGAETELDKNVIERFNDPLIHLIRNAIDHGIMPPEQRLAQGKPRVGTLELSAAHEGSRVVITVSDDGSGIDSEAIKTRAIAKGFIEENTALSPAEILQLIFLPGFSIKNEVTKVSGRGVGLDVVRREINALGGSVRISSQKGQGTSFIMALPLTLAIIEGLLLRVNNISFVIPMEYVKECVKFSPALPKKTQIRFMIKHAGSLLPAVCLGNLFNYPFEPILQEYMVIIRSDITLIGLMVDRIIGNIQTIIKPLDIIYRNAAGIAGATIMGDGSIALILDVPQLIQLAKQQ